MGLTTLPADALPTLDWNAIFVLIGTGVGTAVAVFWNYQKKRATPDTPSKDVILPTTAIADMRWGPELLTEAKGINARLDNIQACLRDWREEDNHRRDIEDAYEKGRRARERGGRGHAD